MDDVIAGGFASGPDWPWSRGFIRIVSWNIERGLRFPAILDFLRAAEADLILLQEVDLHVRRTQYRDVAQELARSLRLHYVFGKEFEELGAGSEGSPAYHGMATLSPWPLEGGRVVRFEGQSNFWKPRWYVPRIECFQRRLGGRLALATVAQIYGRSLASYNLHLESKASDLLRLRQLREALLDASRHEASSLVIVGGDFNMNASVGASAATLRVAEFHDAVGLPERATTAVRSQFRRARPIDWIYVSDGFDSTGHVHDDVQASDHYPVSAEFPVSGLLTPWVQTRST